MGRWEGLLGGGEGFDKIEHTRKTSNKQSKS